MKFIVVNRLINDGVRRCWRISRRAFQSSLPSSGTPRAARIRLANHRRRDQRAVCFAPRAAVALSPSRRRPFHFATARSSRACMVECRRSGGLPSSARRRRCAPAAIHYALLSALRSTFPARRPLTEAGQSAFAGELMKSPISDWPLYIFRSPIGKSLSHSLDAGRGR